MNKKELIDFAEFVKREWNIPTHLRPKVIANMYLKSVHSNALLESQSVSENEDEEKECEHIGSIQWITNDIRYCTKCHEHIYD